MAKKKYMTDTSASDFLGTHLREAIKQHIEYDSKTRMWKVYIANTDSGDGEYCMQTEYIYDGDTNRVVFMKESLAQWDSGWDVA